MLTTIIAVLFSFVLIVDFLATLVDKKINLADCFIRAGMVAACGFLFSQL